MLNLSFKTQENMLAKVQSFKYHKTARRESYTVKYKNKIEETPLLEYCGVLPVLLVKYKHFYSY